MHEKDSRLGKRVTDDVTGLKGTITGIYLQLNGTTRFEIEYVDARGNPQSHWVDSVRCSIE